MALFESIEDEVSAKLSFIDDQANRIQAMEKDLKYLEEKKLVIDKTRAVIFKKIEP